MSNCIELIKLAGGAHDPEVRAQNEAKLLQYIKQEPKNFLKDCVEGFSNSSLDPAVRQMIAVVLRKTLMSPGPNNDEGCFYQSLNGEEKQFIKNMCLSQLIDNNRGIKSAAGTVSD